MNKGKKTYSSPKIVAYKRENEINHKKSTQNLVLAILLCLSFLLLGFFSGTIIERNKNKDDYSEYELLYKVGEFIQQRYYKDVDMETLVDGAINGMLESLDNYSTIYEEVSSGKKGTIGVSMSYDVCGEFRVEQVVAGSPADEAGIKSGDFIYSVNGVKVEGNFVETFSSLMAPAKKVGTKIVLRIRPSRGGEISDDIVLYARASDATYVFSQNDFSGAEYDVSPDIGYIRLTSFADGAVEQMDTAFAQFRQQNKSKLILDLRGNLGGDGEILRKIGEYLVDNEGHTAGIPIIKLVDKKGSERWYKTQENKYIFRDNPNGKIVVLVNANTASASEALVGAMLVAGTCDIVGATTYGKGVAQSILNFLSNLDPAFKIKITTGEYYFDGDISKYVKGSTGERYSIHGVGFTPVGDNFVLSRGGNHLSEDAQFLRAVELLS